MIGKDFWEDFDIDVQTINIELEARAKELVAQYEYEFTAEDLLKLNANTKWAEGGIHQALAAACLAGIKANNVELVEPEVTFKEKSLIERLKGIFR